jgi:hypothetical protein
MQKMVVPDLAQIKAWLKRAGHESWSCEYCDGLHVSSLQSLDGVLDSRLFIEPFGILFTTELDLKASEVFSVNADMTRFNLGLPMLKLFLEVLDSGNLLLMASDAMITTKGINYDQFSEFLGMTIEAKSWLYSECQSLQYLFSPDYEQEAGKPDLKLLLH